MHEQNALDRPSCSWPHCSIKALSHSQPIVRILTAFDSAQALGPLQTILMVAILTSPALRFYLILILTL